MAIKRLLYLLFVFTVLTAKAQQVKDINNQLSLYAKKMQSPLLFVHFDKNVYTNNENVWFTAYLMNYTDASLYHTLSLALVRDAELKLKLNGMKEMLTKEQMKKISGGYSGVSCPTNPCVGDGDCRFFIINNGFTTIACGRCYGTTLDPFVMGHCGAY